MEHSNEVRKQLNVGVITVSDTRDYDTDKGGKAIIEQLKDIEIDVSREHYLIAKDDQADIRASIMKLLHDKVDVIITTGGTGVAKRDVTIEVVTSIIDKEMEGFGEIFRYLSYTEDVGTRAMLSRALCGTKDNTVIFSIPGSVGAVNLAMKKLITQEIHHIVHELNK
ncbi:MULTISPECIES: MogA/MoaB family molybdenum cofactor biosynthesis protein [Staphylococcaceae]|uniref:MogA/MoaB family molybdenum cofactor biosynthesis protein n=1 Tax=Staphylococcaceae TaxID=90964 RepID=UPI000A296ADE|nr:MULTISPECIES: molybdenum cofactor biosynthesis protein B [Macrococcus]ARQ03469.1 Molybdenum cofactor biosynthesis protein B [Macrococcus caseolyticus]MDJ1109369.1 molybdenum cofactor biosynthesis protein B [Macrococcus caseolyticus]PKE33590.1 molybdenum cofactor biosynthesis protein MoaB [Macrococcus caseolyticus]PKF30069.1 molybdenum cofactor biosynthesis protein MoaB [Macrococcus caseolyticus]QYA40204.1 molybdenum cofactor biosynthesis protein MoaB [Macrococcus caseolyticus]